MNFLAESSRRWPLWTSLGVLAVTALIHIIAGTPMYLDGIAQAGLTGEVGGLAVALWHLTSTILVLLVVGLGWATRASHVAGVPILIAVWAICLAFFVIMFGVDVSAGSVISPLVQWTLFVPPAILLPFTRWSRSPSTDVEPVELRQQ